MDWTALRTGILSEFALVLGAALVIAGLVMVAKVGIRFYKWFVMMEEWKGEKDP